MPSPPERPPHQCPQQHFPASHAAVLYCCCKGARDTGLVCLPSSHLPSHLAIQLSTYPPQSSIHPPYSHSSIHTTTYPASQLPSTQSPPSQSPTHPFFHPSSHPATYHAAIHFLSTIQPSIYSSIYSPINFSSPIHHVAVLSFFHFYPLSYYFVHSSIHSSTHLPTYPFIYLFISLFCSALLWNHIQQYLGLTPHSVLRDYSW